MTMMKNIGRSLLLVLLVFALVGCQGAKPSQEGHKKLIYASFFPVADLTQRIVGDKMEVKTLMGPGSEPHSFELKSGDMKKMLEADLIVYNGASMESFIPLLKETIKDDDKFCDLSQGLTLLTSGEGDKAKDQVNPHTWLSIKNAMAQLETLAHRIMELDPANKSYYEQNLKESLAAFSALDKRFSDSLEKVDPSRRIFVVSHAAFNYLAHDYGLKQVAVTGISPDVEPSAKQLAKIADYVKEKGVTTIFFEGKATPKVAQTLAQNTKAHTASLYTMETVSPEEAQKGYLGLMEENLKSLMESFNDPRP